MDKIVSKQTITLDDAHATITVVSTGDGTAKLCVIADPAHHVSCMGEAAPIAQVLVKPGRAPRKGERVMAGGKLHEVADFGYDDAGVLWVTDDTGQGFRWDTVSHVQATE